MEKKDIEELRARVPCAAALEKARFAIDLKESTRKAVKYRRGETEIIIVIHEGRGWFDPLSDAKGDVFSLAEHLGADGFSEALDHVADLVDFTPSELVWTCGSRSKPLATLASRWRARAKPGPGSPTWLYLAEVRALPSIILKEAVAREKLREGPYGSMWAAHTAASGALAGWEERGPQWRGFATGGAKELFRLGAAEPSRVCVTEAAIDAMSLAAVEGLRADTVYVSTGGGWAPATEEAIRVLAGRPGILVVAATDRNAQGDVFAGKVQAIAAQTGCRSSRLRSRAGDWNEDLQAKSKESGGGDQGTRATMRGRLPHARPVRQGRLRPLCGP